MSERRFMLMKITGLLLLQNGLLAAMAFTLSPGLSSAMMAMLAAGVILLSMTTAMMATRIAGGHVLQPASTPISAGSAKPDTAIAGKEILQAYETQLPLSPARRTRSHLAAVASADMDHHIHDELRHRATEETLSALDGALRRLATGDLSVKLETPFPDGFEGLRGDFNRAVTALNDSLTTIIISAGTLHGECAEARLRLVQERSLIPDEVPALSVAGNGLRDVGDLLREQDATLRDVAAVTRSARAHWQQHRNRAAADVTTSDKLKAADSQTAEIAALMRDIAFRTNMLSVNASVAAANGIGTDETLKIFASELRDMAEAGAEAAKRASRLERNVKLSISETRSEADRLAKEEEHLRESFDAIDKKISTLTEASVMASDMVARTGIILDGSLKYASQRRSLEHALETSLERMSQEMATINRHCSRFIQVTIVHDDQTPPDATPPRHRSHLKLVKS